MFITHTKGDSKTPQNITYSVFGVGKVLLCSRNNNALKIENAGKNKSVLVMRKIGLDKNNLCWILTVDSDVFQPVTVFIDY